MQVFFQGTIIWYYSVLLEQTWNKTNRDFKPGAYNPVIGCLSPWAHSLVLMKSVTCCGAGENLLPCIYFSAWTCASVVKSEQIADQHSLGPGLAKKSGKIIYGYNMNKTKESLFAFLSYFLQMNELNWLYCSMILVFFWFILNWNLLVNQ